MRATRRATRTLGTVALIAALGLGAAACEGGDETGGGAQEEGEVEDVVEQTADEADEIGSESEAPNTGDDVGDESPGEG